MKIKFVEKDRKYANRKSGDIKISAVGKRTIYITVNHKLEHLIASEDGYTQVGICENKMYFKKSTEAKGYKCSQQKNPNYARIAIASSELFDFATKYANGYRLLFDSDLDLYYISGKETIQRK